MVTQSLIQLFSRDLNKLKEEINLYKDESNIWKTKGSVTNTAGNLCLHLIGNLNHFIGAALGDSGYIRQRDLEFSLKNISRKEMTKQIDDTILIIELALKQLSNDDLKKEYTYRVFKLPTSTEYFLIHLAMHLTYHLGQINYHRRMLDK
ncbi:MAG: DUF1572 family protein [Winogradskyella sp.]|uniref:DinB family protein n=1 Tax=Winogradskyella sp. TaxID=1883156 RepID=UPI0017B6434C|nr:DUF1572 family protein [Winogradskyella sp.]